MKAIVKLVLQGLVAVLPLGLTAYCLYWLLASIESQTKTLLLWLMPGQNYFTGLGIIATLVALFFIGLLVNAYGVRYLLRLSDSLLARIPLVKSLHGAFQDIMRVFTLTERKELQTVVSMDIGNDTHLIGFITGEKSGQKLFPDEQGGKVGVYFPMSYQIGGFTAYVARKRLRPLDIGVEEAMRIAITGGVQNQKNTPK